MHACTSLQPCKIKKEKKNVRKSPKFWVIFDMIFVKAYLEQ